MHRAITLSGFVLLFGCDERRSPLPGTPPPSTPPATSSVTSPASSPSAVVLGVTLPAGCRTYRDNSGAGHEGAPYEEHWAACARGFDALVAWAKAEEKAGRLAPHTVGRWAAGDITITPTRIESRPTGAGRPPSAAASLLALRRQGKPSPCPPCGSGKTLPGCSCP